MRQFFSEGEAQTKVVMLSYLLASLPLQSLSVVMGVHAVRRMYRARHLGLRPLLSAGGGSLLGLLGLHVAQTILNRRLRSWVKSLNITPPG